MNIDELSRSVSNHQVVNASQIESGRSVDSCKSGGEGIKDTVDMSVLARLIAGSATDLARVHKLRPEKVAAFQERNFGVADINDEMIDTIFSRIASS